MVSNRNSMQPVDAGTVVVTGGSLAEAYARVRDKFGSEAAIVGSRTATRGHAKGIGRRTVVEVLVQPGGVTAGQPDDPPGDRELLAELAGEIERLEACLRDIGDRVATSGVETATAGFDPLAEALTANGAAAPTVHNLMTRFTSETGKERADRPAALAWLENELPAAGGRWEDFRGWHAFVGAAGSGRTELIVALAGRLTQSGLATVLLQVLDEKPGEVRRLQTSAAEYGFDAAVIRSVDQLDRVGESLREYDVVLLDLPPLHHPTMRPGGAIHDRLADDQNLQRHLIVPLDGDFDDLDEHVRGARDWTCDWTGLTRLDRSGRPAKILDLLARIPLPLVLLGSGAGAPSLRIATAGGVIDLMLADAATRVAGVPATAGS